MNVTKLKKCILIGISILLSENYNSCAAAQEDRTQSDMYKMIKSLQSMYVQMEEPLFPLGKDFTIKNSPVYLQYSDNVPFRPDSRDPEPIMRKGFKIFTRAIDRASTEVGYLIVQSLPAHPLFKEPTIDLSWLFINETERSKQYGSYAVRIFEGIFKHHPGRFADAKILSARTNEENTTMCHILEKNGWTQAEDRNQPNMVDFKKARPKI